MLYCVPCFVAVLLLRRYISLSYRFFPLFFYYFCIDHLLPLVLLVTAYFTFYSESNFVELLLFSGGFFSVLGIVEVLFGYGHYEPYLLFILPTVRMGILLFLPIFFLRFREWYGVVRALFLTLLIFVPFLTAAISYLHLRFYVLWAGLLAGLFFLGSLLYLFLEREA